jgi:hypothetical protein
METERPMGLIAWQLIRIPKEGIYLLLNGNLD